VQRAARARPPREAALHDARRRCDLMTVTHPTPPHADRPARPAANSDGELAPVGPVGRIGRWAATHGRAVSLVWLVLAVCLGAFAPQVEHALSGAGWEVSGSESVRARDRIDRGFAGRGTYALQVVVSSQSRTADDPAFQRTLARVQRLLDRDRRVGDVVAPRAGDGLSPDGHTALVVGGAHAAPDDMVRAADDLKARVAAAGSATVRANLTGAPGLWSDFNHDNKSAMLRSEVISWPVTLAILLLAFGSLVAAGLPLMLTVLGLVCEAGMLALGGRVVDISIWAMNFALMFALALGIDYALFIVARFRQAHVDEELAPVEAVARAMDTAGQAVLLSGLTVLIALSAVLVVPSPAFRSTAIGIILAVCFVLVASLTLLPAVLARLGGRVNRLALPWIKRGGQRSPRLAAWARQAWLHPLPFGLTGLLVLAALSWPVAQLDTGMPSVAVAPAQDSSRQGFEQLRRGFGAGAPAALQVVAPASTSRELAATLRADPGIDEVLPARPGEGGLALVQALPRGELSADAIGATIDRLRAALPGGALIGGLAAENHDLELALGDAAPRVIVLVLALGFLLLLIALRAPVIALAGVLLNVLATLAAFGVGKWIFQDGALSGMLGFESQGHLNAWAPILFFVMLFALGMDYTVFLLASAKERWERSADAREAAVEGIAISGPVITAAAAVMVAVFFTFALSGPLPPKEMGVILGVAVLIDALLVRLLLMPVVLRLLGAAAWWLPSRLDRWLPDVRFGHL
jgi:RND superfamily putative drug exporter